MDENDIKEIVQKFEATVPPGDDEAARVFFEEVFPNFSQDLKDAFLREALVSAIEQSAEELMAERKGESEA